MKVLMFGWEFPPHISGGLGTACYGITRGLHANDVDIAFVIPRTRGDEDRSFSEILGANEVPIPDDPPEGEPTMPPKEAVVRKVETSTGFVHEAMAPLLELLTVDSPLRPYLTAAGYEERLARIPGGTTAKAVTTARELLTSLALESVVPEGDPPKGAVRRFDFQGSYGPDLVSEVGRYAVVAGEIARNREFDLVHCHDWLTIPAGIVAARVSGKPLIVHIHACEHDRSGDNINHEVKAIEQAGLSAADRVVTVSHYTARILREKYNVDPQKIRVVHNAVLHEEQVRQWKVKKTISDPLVLFLGRVTFQKGPDYFLEAAARVIKAMPNARFALSGSGDMLPGLIERAARLGIARNLYFTGFLRGHDVEKMYAMADIYVMPSVSEPFGISPLEAMALDVPVIVSRQSGVSEILRNALKIDFWDVDDLSNKILALLRYPALGRQLVEEGREEVRNLRWEQQGRILADVYREFAA